jgi:hypothetical protein
LLEQFDGGAELFPSDTAAAVAAEAEALRRFIIPQITQAATAYEIWHGPCVDEADRQALIDAAGIEVTETSVLDWSAYGLETDEVALHARREREPTGGKTRWTF